VAWPGADYQEVRALLAREHGEAICQSVSSELADHDSSLCRLLANEVGHCLEQVMADVDHLRSLRIAVPAISIRQDVRIGRDVRKNEATIQAAGQGGGDKCGVGGLTRAIDPDDDGTAHDGSPSSMSTVPSCVWDALAGMGTGVHFEPCFAPLRLAAGC
jgi:hypothetical protein